MGRKGGRAASASPPPTSDDSEPHQPLTEKLLLEDRVAEAKGSAPGEGSGRSASQIKREKQKAAAARNLAVAADAGGRPSNGSDHQSSVKSASQVKREKQKAAAARKKAAANAAAMSSPDLHVIFSTRYPLSAKGESDVAAAEMTFDQAAAALLEVRSLDADAVRSSDAIRVLLDSAREEVEQLQPGGSKKLLPRTLKWCASNMPLLNGFLALPQEARSDAPAVRLGSARLLLVELLMVLLAAKRPPSTTALVGCRPPPTSSLAKLLLAHPNASIFGDAVLRLVRAMFQMGTKPLRAAVLGGPEPLQSVVVSALSAEVAAVVHNGPAPPSAPTRPHWIAIASALEAAAAADREAQGVLAMQAGWAELVLALPALRARYSEGSLCGPPPIRPPGGAGRVDGEIDPYLAAMCGEMGQYLAALQRVQDMAAA